MMGIADRHKQNLDGWIDGDTHGYCLRVQYEDTDVSGITYHAQYLAFAERARSAYLRLLGIDQSALLSNHDQANHDQANHDQANHDQANHDQANHDQANHNQGFVVRRIEIDYIDAAPYDSLLWIETKLVKMGAASLKLQQIVNNNENGHIVARLFVDIVFVTFDENRKIRPKKISNRIRHKLVSTGGHR